MESEVEGSTNCCVSGLVYRCRSPAGGHGDRRARLDGVGQHRNSDVWQDNGWGRRGPDRARPQAGQQLHAQRCRMVTKLTVYLEPTGTAGTQAIEGVIYADASGSPGALLASTSQLTFTSGEAAGWYDLPFSSGVSLQPGKYWLGLLSGASAQVAAFAYDNVPGSRDYNANAYSSGPSNPFGPFSTDGEQMSVYATYTPTSPPPPPTITLGKTTVGGSSDSFAPDRKRVSAYTLTTGGTISKLTIYLAPGGVTGQQVVEGVIYADASGSAGALLATTNELTFSSGQAAGWYDLPLSAPLAVQPAKYWIGVITGAASNVAGFRFDPSRTRATSAPTHSPPGPAIRSDLFPPMTNRCRCTRQSLPRARRLPSTTSTSSQPTRSTSTTWITTCGS